MPVRVRKVRGGYSVKHSGKVSAKKTTRRKALRQKKLLGATKHGFKPRKNK